MSGASAFSLDFTGLATDGSVSLSGADGDQLVISVPGFGNVAFGVAEKDATASVVEIDGVPAIEFDDARTITIDFFAGSPVENVLVSFVGVDQGESPTYTSLTDTSGVARIPVGTVGIQGLTFDRVGPKVPEPSTAILGLLGAVALLRRRR
jgi:hypothetical protein